MVNNENELVVMVVFAYNMKDSNRRPWIYGVYKDHSEGLGVQNKMQNSEDYGHLHWTNNLVEVK